MVHILSALMAHFANALMGGLQLANHLAKSRPEIKVVLMSGYTHEAITLGDAVLDREESRVSSKEFE